MEEDSVNEKNIEMRFKVDNFDFIFQKMKEYYQCDLIQNDTYYNVPKGRLIFREELYRKPHFIRDFGPDQATYKCPIDSLSDFMKIFGDFISLKEEVVVKKSRQLFLYKNARIYLDFIASLIHTDYVEIVIMIRNEEEENNSKALMNELIIMMHLGDSAIINYDYREMLMNK
jgi:adenylate cyclase class IV